MTNLELSDLEIIKLNKEYPIFNATLNDLELLSLSINTKIPAVKIKQWDILRRNQSQVLPHSCSAPINIACTEFQFPLEMTFSTNANADHIANELHKPPPKSLSNAQILRLESIYPVFNRQENPESLYEISEEEGIPLEDVIQWDVNRRKSSEGVKKVGLKRVISCITPPPNTEQQTVAEKDVKRSKKFTRDENCVLWNLHHIFSKTPQDVNNCVLSNLHHIFSKTPQDVNQFITETRKNITAILCQRKRTHLILFIPKEIGKTANERLWSLNKLTIRTAIPIFLTTCLVNSYPATFISNHKILNKYRNYDPYVYECVSWKNMPSPSLAKYRKLYMETLIKILKSKDSHSSPTSNCVFEFINGSPEMTIAKYLEHIKPEDAGELVQDTIRCGTSMICPSLSTVKCDKSRCPHILHLDMLKHVEMPKDNITEQPTIQQKNLYRYNNFNMGHLGISKYLNYDFQDAVDMPNDLEDLMSDIRKKQDCAVSNFVYIVAAIHSDDISQTPNILTMKLIEEGLNVYLYVGRSRYAGMGKHHIDNIRTTFSRTIRHYELNTFYMLRNIPFKSFMLAEKWEAIYQVILLHINHMIGSPNIFCTNERLEVSAFDFLSNDELKDIYHIFQQDNLQFLYDNPENVPCNLNFGFLKSPLFLGEGVAKFFR